MLWCIIKLLSPLAVLTHSYRYAFWVKSVTTYIYMFEWVKKILDLDEVVVNKKEFHASKQPIVLNSVNVNKIVTFARFKCNGKMFEYFIGL